MQKQLTQSEIELQRSQPVITILEDPIVPLEKSGPNRKLIVLGSVLLGILLGSGIAFIQNWLELKRQNQGDSVKLEEIQNLLGSLLPRRLRRISNSPR